MSALRFATAIFCDDIRFELGNKVSLIGVYGTDLYTNELPCFIPRIGVFFRVTCPNDDPVQKQRFQVLKGSEVLLDLEIPSEQIASETNMSVVPASRRPAGHDAPTRRQTQFNAVLPPLTVLEACTLKAYVYVGDVEFLAAKLRIGPMPEASPTSSLSAIEG